MKKKVILATIIFLLVGVTSLYIWGFLRPDDSYNDEILIHENLLNELRVGEFEHNIVVDGVSLNDVMFQSINTCDIYTHIHLSPILFALCAEPQFERNAQGIYSVTFVGINGNIEIIQESNTFLLDGIPISSDKLSATVIDGRLYVSIQFFEDVFGVNRVYFSDGVLFIYSI